MIAGRARLWVFLLGAAVTSVLFINFCNLVFQCGCQSLWAGADAHCNVHHAGAGHHRCPWCQVGLTGGVAIWGLIVFTQWWVSGRAARLGSMWLMLLTLAAFPVSGGVLALAAGLYFRYWT